MDPRVEPEDDGEGAESYAAAMRRLVLLAPAAPTRLFAGLPEGVEIQRVGLVEAIEATRAFLGLPLMLAEAGTQVSTAAPPL